MVADSITVTAWVAGFGTDMRVTYEAGPSGYGLARHLLAHDIDCVIAAPSKLLRASGDHVKTDRRDALGLARMLSLGRSPRRGFPPWTRKAYEMFPERGNAL